MQTSPIGTHMQFHTLERDEDGKYVVECTDLPGCLSEGEGSEEAFENISEAIIGCLKSRLKIAGDKLKIPSIDRKIDISQGPWNWASQETNRQGRSN
ncbi:MAG TPA: type II toxin-antitoxin system HicB family antitoxin [Methanothrix sp.]